MGKTSRISLYGICIRMFACIYTSLLLSISATKFPEVLSRAIRGVALTNYNWICILKKNQSYRAWFFLGGGGLNHSCKDQT